jgi:thiol-disulfide isomerase/thioredoxin
MFCIVAFIVLSILGIFSATNRALAREAMDCVFRRVTLRPCNTGFDEKMKARILGSVITRSETAAMFINKNFELLSWVFFLLFFASGIMAVRGVYLFYTTGSCNGLNSSGFCVFDPTGANNQVSSGSGCNVKPKNESDLSLNGINLAGFPVMNPNAPDKIVMIGCYHCEYTRKAYPMILDLVDRYGASFSYINYPTKEDTDYFSRLAYCVNQQAPEAFWQFNAQFFTGEKERLDDEAFVDQTLAGLGIDAGAVKTCTSSQQTETTVQEQLKEIQKTRFYGTPTIFINGKAYVGPKPYRVYAIRLKGLFYWLR